MENIIFQIYGTFILTLGGFVLPIITIAMSAFPDGVKVLKENYKNKQKQAEANLAKEIQKQKNQDKADYTLLSKNIAILKLTQKEAKRRLSYLNPGVILRKSALAVGVSLTSFLMGLYFYLQPFYIPLSLFVISIGMVVWAITIFYNAIGIIVEASTEVQLKHKVSEEKTLELLTAIADNSKKDGASLFIDQKYIKIYFENEILTEGKEYTFSVNKEHSIDVHVSNVSEFMWKTTELGFYFPEEFLIKDASTFNIFVGGKQKILRFNHDHIQSLEKMDLGKINLTFLTSGIFEVTAFTKGENLKRKTIKFKIKVVD